MELIGKGAEAFVYKVNFYGLPAIRKVRKRKAYRHATLDRRLRQERTRREAKLLHLAKKAGLKAPVVLLLEKYAITMSFVEGERPKAEEVWEEMAVMLAKLHSHNIIHGDFTVANILKAKDGLYIIDFGLGRVSGKIEEKADDLFTFLYSLPQELKEKALSAYLRAGGSKEVVRRIESIRRRMRYVKG